MSKFSPRATTVNFAICGICIFGFFHWLYYFPRTVDDLFIYLRYAQNFAGGLGFSFNPPERIEGFSSILWVLILSGGIGVGINPVTWAKIASFGFLFLLLFSAHLLSKHLSNGSSLSGLLTTTIIASCTYIVSWSSYGLETPMFLSLMIICWLIIETAGGKAGAVNIVRASVTFFLFALSRPEAPMLLALMLAFNLVFSKKLVKIHKKKLQISPLPPGKTLITASAVALAALICVELFRFFYFGELLPHIHYAKTGGSKTISNLLPLFAEGASPIEISFVICLIVASIYFTTRGKATSITGGIFSCLVFVSVVDRDWMPNMRFFLPVFVAGAVMIPAMAVELWKWEGTPSRLLSVLAILISIGFSLYTLSIEVRFSQAEYQTHGMKIHWIRVKSTQSISETIKCLRKVPPPHIFSLSVEKQGMIHQLFDVIEASSTPLPDSWYIGRDIGRVGYLSEVNIIDTDGLFTPELSEDKQWREKGEVNDKLIKKLFSKNVICGELLEPQWQVAFVRNRSISKKYLVTAKIGSLPKNFRLKNRIPPSFEQILKRYNYALSKLPRSYYIQTLHGEVVGAVVEERSKHIKNVIELNKNYIVKERNIRELKEIPFFPEIGIATLGCKVRSPIALRGGRLIIDCYFKKIKQTDSEGYKLFMHFEGRGRFLADHKLYEGLIPIRSWKKGEIYRESHAVKIPSTIPPGSYVVYFGFFNDANRATVVPPHFTDGKNRLIGPVIRIK